MFLLSHCFVAWLQYPEQHAVSLSQVIPMFLHFSWQRPDVMLQMSPLQQSLALEHFSPAQRQDGMSLHIPKTRLQNPEQHSLALLHFALLLMQVGAVVLFAVSFWHVTGSGVGQASHCLQLAIDAFAHATAFITDALLAFSSWPLSSLYVPFGSIVATPTMLAPPDE
jgi:hypothetical protein